MSLEDVRRKLLEKKLGILEYFQVAFDTLKGIFKENTGVAILIFVFTFIKNITTIAESVLDEIVFYHQINKIEINELVVLLAKRSIILNLVLSIISFFVMAYFFRKIALTIEGRENDLKLGKLFLKTLIIFVILNVAKFIGDGMAEVAIGGIILILFFIAIILISFWALWYWEAYYIRDLGILESFDYSLELSYGNRLRKFFPGLIFAVGVVVFVKITGKIVNFFNVENLFITVIAAFIFLSIFSLIIMYAQILDTVIFLNVEYDYLGKNLNKELKFENENKNKLDENHQNLDNFLNNDKNNRKVNDGK